MKEESRIEALEHELKILKNEIQTTLLEIREQILNHYYPELRAEEPLRSLSLPVRPQVGRPGVPPKPIHRIEEPNSTLSEIAAKGQVQPFSDIFLEDLDDDENPGNSLVNSRRPIATPLDEEMDEDYEDDDDDTDDSPVLGATENFKVQTIGTPTGNKFAVTPQTREVDFRQLKQASAGGSAPKAVATPIPPSVPTPAPEKSEAPAPKANRQTFAALATWVSDGVAKVGKERTSQVVETYATGGKLAGETRNSLLQLISLADDVEPTSPVGSQEMLALMVGLDQILRDA